MLIPAAGTPGSRDSPARAARDRAEPAAGAETGDTATCAADPADPAEAVDEVAAAVVAALGDDLDGGFVVLYDAYRTPVFSTALRLCGRWAEAEDLAAEAFLRAYRALLGYEPGRIAELRPRAWLLTILMNLWRNSRRGAARKPPPGPLEAAPDPADPAEGVEAAAARHETGRELAGLLAQLPEAQRAAVVLRHAADLPIAEIAAVLDVPEGTVKSHISRGLARLRKLHDSKGAPHAF
ncbi:RNA polymerase sigma factor [Actinomadura barringtoniae]|uniref:RNA polymerase sigma factor n=2 Tax=Actinomadura barringtoniae TaxID=1427535 RepID=A0A939PTD2_9ACTN|nr:RNA polymerase sigma factor [Actinomadura barringtoniae]